MFIFRRFPTLVVDWNDFINFPFPSTSVIVFDCLQVRSVTLDSWTCDQVRMMQEMGNERARVRSLSLSHPLLSVEVC